MKTKLIVGLGNYGTSYENTRHNWGFLMLDEIAKSHNFLLFNNKFDAKFSLQKIYNHNVILLKPQTYMNNSGISVIQCINFYKISLNDIIVIHDDLDLPIGRIKIKKGGGNGGHNGLKSIDNNVGIEYIRLRLGIDKPIYKSQISDYVLQDFSFDERKIVDFTNEFIAVHFKDLLLCRHDDLMNSYAINIKKLMRE